MLAPSGYIRYQDQICIEVEWLTDPDNEVMTKHSYNNLVRRGQINRVRRACYMTSALVSYSSLPDRFKEKVHALLGSPTSFKDNLLRKHCVQDHEALEFYSKYTLSDGRHLPMNKQREYANNAMMLNAIHQVLGIMKGARRSSGDSGSGVWDRIIMMIERIEDIDHKLGRNKRRLQEKLRVYNQEGYVSLISGKWLNKSASKVKDSQQEALLRQLLRRHNNFDNEQIATIYNEVAVAQMWKPITASTVGNYREKWDLETYSGRKGVDKAEGFNNAKAMMVKRKAPSLPLYYWTVDGWDAELLYQATTTNAKGHEVTTYHNRPTIVVILDPCIKYPVGYAIGTHETPQLIKEALRNAVNHTATLFGYRHKVLQLQNDRYGGKKLKSLYESITELHTPAKAKNAKSKAIEPWFNHVLNHNYCQFEENWAGYGITSKAGKQPNTEYTNAIKKQFPDYEGVCLQLTQMIETERARLQEKYVALYQDLDMEDRIPMTDNDYLFWLGERTGRTNRVAHDGLHLTINKTEHVYDSFDMGFRRKAHESWTIAFDPENMDKVLAHTEDGSTRFVLEHKHLQPMAVKDRQEGDVEALNRIQNFNQNMIEDIQEGMIEDAQEVNELMIGNPKLEGTLAKMLITNSMGQHKDQRNLDKQKVKQIAAKTERKEAKKQEKSNQQKIQDYYKGKVDMSKYL